LSAQKWKVSCNKVGDTQRTKEQEPPQPENEARRAMMMHQMSQNQSGNTKQISKGNFSRAWPIFWGIQMSQFQDEPD